MPCALHGYLSPFHELSRNRCRHLRTVSIQTHSIDCTVRRSEGKQRCVPPQCTKGRGDSLRTSPLHTGNTQAYLSSLSSRLTSFFCFRVSSRLRRASASSLTARSRSRLRLSHRVLVKKGEAMVTGNGKNAERAHSLYHTTYQPLFLRFSLIKHPDQPTM